MSKSQKGNDYDKVDIVDQKDGKKKKKGEKEDDDEEDDKKKKVGSGSWDSTLVFLFCSSVVFCRK